MSMGMKIGGIVLGLMGWITAIITCALPMWKVSAFFRDNTVTQIDWEGIWMSCVVNSTGQKQCKTYDSVLTLSVDLQAARAMTVITIILGVLALMSFILGSKCTNCIEDEASKAKVTIISGVLLIIAGLLQVIPVSWTANTIIRDFYNPLIPSSQQRELGASLYIGFAAAALLIIGGALLCCTCPPWERKHKVFKIGDSAPLSTSAYKNKEEQGFYDAEDDVSEVSIVMYSQCETGAGPVENLLFKMLSSHPSKIV